MADLRAGTAKIDITPPPGTPLDGNVRPKGSDGTHDLLYSRILVLNDGITQLAIIANDLIGFSRDFVAGLRSLIEKKAGISQKNIMVACSHTHSGPATLGIFNEPALDWLPVLCRDIAAGVSQAGGSLREVNIRAGRGMEETVAHNRRIRMKDGSIRMNWEDLPLSQVDCPAGPIDPEVGVVCIADSRDNLIAVLVNYTCHPAVLAGQNFLVSADYPGYAMKFIEDKANTMCLFTNGACGDINHIDINNPGQDRGFEEAQRLGLLLGREVWRVGQEAKLVARSRLGALSEDMDLPLRDISESELKWAKEVVRKSKQKEFSLADGVPLEMFARGILELHRQANEKIVTEIQVLTIGNIAFAAIGCELFVELGLEIKKKSPFPYTFVSGYTNDYVGYIPTKKAFGEGGHEVKTANWSKLVPEAGDKVVEKALDLANKLFNRGHSDSER